MFSKKLQNMTEMVPFVSHAAESFAFLKQTWEKVNIYSFRQKFS